MKAYHDYKRPWRACLRRHLRGGRRFAAKVAVREETR